MFFMLCGRATMKTRTHQVRTLKLTLMKNDVISNCELIQLRINFMSFCEVDGHTRGVCLFHHPCSIHWGHNTAEGEARWCLDFKELSMPITYHPVQCTHGGVDLSDQLIQY
ncbi:hypothetical protein ANANG_G00002720, partial [Anguilla anguilla]